MNSGKQQRNNYHDLRFKWDTEISTIRYHFGLSLGVCVCVLGQEIRIKLCRGLKCKSVSVYSVELYDVGVGGAMNDTIGRLLVFVLYRYGEA